VWEQYALYPTTPLATLRTELTARGKALAAQINRIAALDGRVVVGKLHDLSYTPYSVTETQNNPDTGDGTRQQVIRALVLAFNDGFFADLNNDAQHIGLFDPDQNLGTIILNPGNIGLTSATAAACQTTAVLPNCNTGTLVTGATATTYLYADDRHLAYQGHLQFSALAYSRANNNPF
jgi:phospholipase/lecithinase/hemolysin